MTIPFSKKSSSWLCRRVNITAPEFLYNKIAGVQPAISVRKYFSTTKNGKRIVN